MNIFVLDEDPRLAAKYHCDKHVPKMCVELLQQLVSAARRHGAIDRMLPINQSGSPHKGGYHNHPCTIWCGDSRINYMWATAHASSLCYEFRRRFKKRHFCESGINIISQLTDIVPIGNLTDFVLAMPDEHKSSDAVESYRSYYMTKKFAKWERGRNTPDWYKQRNER